MNAGSSRHDGIACLPPSLSHDDLPSVRGSGVKEREAQDETDWRSPSARNSAMTVADGDAVVRAKKTLELRLRLKRSKEQIGSIHLIFLLAQCTICLALLGTELTHAKGNQGN